MKKKLMCCLMLMSLLCSFTPFVASAASAGNTVKEIPTVNLTQEINRAYNGISDIPITSEMKNDFSAVAVASDGTEFTPDVYYTVRDLGVLDSGERMYATTAVTSAQKTETGANTALGGDVRVAATLYWTDNAGMSNSLDRVTGNWTCYDGSSVSNRYLTYQSSNLAYVVIDRETIPLYSNSVNKTFSGITGYRLAATLEARCYPTSNQTGNDWVTLKLTLTSKITTTAAATS